MRGTLALSLLLVCIGAPAAADVMGEDVYVCQDKKLGDSCKVEQSVVTPYTGTCENGEYCHLVYGTCDSGGPPCGTACGPALVCKPGSAEDDGGCAITGRVATSAGSLLLGLALLGLCLRRARR